jgi:molybdenum-dependent DNA-binding transcriptional regulator ModE/AraC-like DNA-binding protein
MRLLIDLGLFREPLQSHPRGPKHITEPDLRKAIIEDGLSAREAARLFGVSRATTQQRCRVYNIPLADRTYPRHNIDPDILRSLYVDQRLTLHEVAEQVGMSPSNVSRILQANRVPLRGRGGASHRVARTPTDVPPLLAAALKGQYGRQRVQRFQHVAASRSLNQAAQRLGVSQATLTDQVQQLEQAVGGPLLNRNERTNHPHTLTALGQELLHEADENLGAPDVPMQPGGILGDCLSLFRGEERLQRFVTIATSSSILEAATRLDSDPSTVVRSVRALEKALGVNLIEHHARSQPVRLTADGTELLRSAKRHTIR